MRHTSPSVADNGDRIRPIASANDTPLLMDPSPSREPHLLVVDDDADILDLARRYFGAQGFRVSAVADGASMRTTLAQGSVDLVLLDLGLPGEDGLDLTRYLRTHWGGPVIIVTGRGESVDRVVGLELGADDYVTKPFDLRELLARIRSVLRRTRGGGAAAQPAVPPPDEGSVRFAGYRLDPAARELRTDAGDPVALTAGEYALLQVFLDRPNTVLSRDHLISRLHGRDAGPYDRAVDVQIGRLRRKLEVDPARPVLIKSVRGAGYLFAAKPQRG
jgi:two-component system, OmpR family, response regulator